jgi:carboxyl-terminal processing protease
VRREDRAADIPLVRRRVEVHSVSEVKMLEQNVGYIKLDKFAQNSSEEFDRALWGLYRDGMKSLVIDVRGNPGGLLTTAIQMSNKFVPSGTLVSTRGRDLADNTVEYASRQRAWKLPLVVLVDGNSASASEIFAAAVQENGRGLIVGERTYGKGTVQTHFPLQTVSANLRLTTAQFFSPSGRVMAGAGVEPDIQAE